MFSQSRQARKADGKAELPPNDSGTAIFASFAPWREEIGIRAIREIRCKVRSPLRPSGNRNLCGFCVFAGKESAKDTIAIRITSTIMRDGLDSRDGNSRRRPARQLLPTVPTPVAHWGSTTPATRLATKNDPLHIPEAPEYIWPCRGNFAGTTRAQAEFAGGLQLDGSPAPSARGSRIQRDQPRSLRSMSASASSQSSRGSDLKPLRWAM